MKYELWDALELGHDKLVAWDQLLTESPIYRNPNFSPWFTKALAPYSSTKVGMLWDKQKLMAVMPFHACPDGKCEAIALGVSDYHGPVFNYNSKADYLSFLNNLKIKEFVFDHLVAELQIKPLNLSWHKVSLINLAKGEMNYRWDLRRKGSKVWHEVENKLRRLKRDFDNVVFKQSIKSKEILDLLIELKSHQFKENKVKDDFATPWVRPFLHELLNTQEISCRGILSGLFADERPIALHMGSVSSHVFQTCYTVYDKNFESYSPGSIMLMMQIRYCLKKRIPILDLGKGEEAYKKRWANDHLWVAEGRITI